MKVKVISLPFIFYVLYVLCFTRPRYQVSLTIAPLVLLMSSYFQAIHSVLMEAHMVYKNTNMLNGDYIILSITLLKLNGAINGHN